MQSETGWHPKRFSSFDSIVQQVIAHRKGNPHLITKNHHTIDPVAVANEVDNYNTKVCQKMGWTQFIEGGAALPVPFRQRGVIPPPPQPSHGSLSQSLANVVAGKRTIVEFIANKQEAVPDDVAIKRAHVCAKCPLNRTGGWLALFTKPAAEAIRQKLALRSKMKLVTPLDDQLGVCKACDCPLPLMIHFPLQTKLKHMTEKAKASLHADCWILDESAQA